MDEGRGCLDGGDGRGGRGGGGRGGGGRGGGGRGGGGRTGGGVGVGGVGVGGRGGRGLVSRRRIRLIENPRIGGWGRKMEIRVSEGDCYMHILFS